MPSAPADLHIRLGERMILEGFLQTKTWGGNTEMRIMSYFEREHELMFLNILNRPFWLFYFHYDSPLWIHRGRRWYYLGALGDKTLSSESPWRQRPDSTTAVRQPDTQADGSSWNWDPGRGIVQPIATNLSTWSLSDGPEARLNRVKCEFTLDLLWAPPIRQMITISFFPPWSWIRWIGPLPHHWLDDRKRETERECKNALNGTGWIHFPIWKINAKKNLMRKMGFYLCHLKNNVSLKSVVEAITSHHAGEQTYWQVQSGNQRRRETFLLPVESSDFLPEAE